MSEHPNPHIFPHPSNANLGLTLRDYFAGQTIPMLISYVARSPFTNEQLAKAAYEFADAMLAERER